MINYKGALGGLFKCFGGGSDCEEYYNHDEFEIIEEVTVTTTTITTTTIEEYLYEPIYFK